VILIDRYVMACPSEFKNERVTFSYCITSVSDISRDSGNVVVYRRDISVEFTKSLDREDGDSEGLAVNE